MFYVSLDNIDDQNIGFMMTNNMQDKEINRDVRFDCFKSSNWPVVPVLAFSCLVVSSHTPKEGYPKFQGD